MKTIYILVVLLSLSVVSWAVTVDLYPNEDMYTDIDHPGDNPVRTELWTANFAAAGHFERIMISFDLADFDGFEVESAILHLTRFYSCPSGGTTAATIYPVTQAWQQSTWPHTQHIAYDATQPMPYVFRGTGGNTINYFEVDITAFVQKWLSGDIPNYGLLIMANNNQKFSKFYATEHGNASYRPRLSLTVNPTPANDTHQNKPQLKASNYPNPFNPSTTISYNLPVAGAARIDVFNIKGQLVKNLVNKTLPAGGHQVNWDGTSSTGVTVPSGVYYYRVSSKGYKLVKPMVLVK